MVVIIRVARGLLKLRYILLGSAVGGGYHASKRIEEFKERMPDFSWISDVFPDQEKFDRFKDAFEAIIHQYSKDDGWLNKFSFSVSDKYDLMKQWIEEAKINRKNDIAQKTALVSDDEANINEPVLLKNESPNYTSSTSKNSSQATAAQERLSKLQNELMTLQTRYQREIEKLEKENKELRKQILIKSKGEKPSRKVRKSLIDMYSDVLDELCDYDTSYDTQDHLPRVIVIGDQSAGKTSVLEMIAGARIFPRGGGEMMTRSPVKVTLSEGPYHIAKFKDNSREYDISSENELRELRKEIEIRMRNSVKGGKTVSKEVISLSVQGPGIPRMVLVDLPGIISTVTSEMAADTRDAIRDISKMYMSNPNAIILCIQDGSVDAERSIVTELVSQMDPNGKRTIFVLTKVDLAEKNMTNPSRIRKILDGKLFPMKALGYFAVVTGKGDRDEKIESIKRYEEEFFVNSTLCRDGVLNPSQCSTQSLSLAVSECFWKMIKSSVEQQADAFKALRFNLETEWNNMYPRMREWDRDELFDKAKAHLFDQIVNLSLVSASRWEELISKKLFERVRTYIVKDLYFSALKKNSTNLFKTQVDIQLKKWVESTLPLVAVEVGIEVLRDEFDNLMEKSKTLSSYDSILEKFQNAVIEESWRRLQWEPKATEVLKVIQLNALEDYLVPDKISWENAIDFFQDCLKGQLAETQNELLEFLGPGWYERWTRWKYRTSENHVNVAIKHELEKHFPRLKNSGENLPDDVFAALRQNLQTENIEVDNERIHKVWHLIYTIHLIQEAISRSENCRKCFYWYKQGVEAEIRYDDVIVFWRIMKTLNATANALRQQIINRESRRLEKEIKQVLEEFGQDSEKKIELLTGRRVDLAEELKRVKLIQEKLEEFIAALELEK